MSLLTHINRVPLFSTMKEALAWGKVYKLRGFHTHRWKRQIGYMGGANHRQTNTRRPARRILTSTPTTRQPTRRQTQQAPIQIRRIINPRVPGSGATGGGGGGGY